MKFNYRTGRIIINNLIPSTGKSSWIWGGVLLATLCVAGLCVFNLWKAQDKSDSTVSTPVAPGQTQPVVTPQQPPVEKYEGPLAVSLSFTPWRIQQGSNSVLSAAIKGGKAPYTYEYQTRPGGTRTWLPCSLSEATTDRTWPGNIQARVRVVDSVNETSAWSAAASLVVLAGTGPKVSGLKVTASDAASNVDVQHSPAPQRAIVTLESAPAISKSDVVNTNEVTEL